MATSSSKWNLWLISLFFIISCEFYFGSALVRARNRNFISSLSISATTDEIEADVNFKNPEISSSEEILAPAEKYVPTWDSLDSRPLPKWYDEAKVGIFIHWGVFSVPSLTDAWFWDYWKGGNKACIDFMKNNYPPNFTYQDFGPQFTAEFFDPNYWADTFSKAGAKYVVLTSKHHEGFTLWPSKYSFSWNSMDVGPKRDLVGELAQAIRQKTNITFGLYHSLYEWFHPLYLSDKASGFKTNEFVMNKMMPELRGLINTYKPEVIWSDGDWEAPSDFWQSKEFLTWLYNDSPVKDTVVTNDRWGKECGCKHGGYLTCKDHYNPGVLQPKKWENCLTLDKGSWGYRRVATLKDYKTIESVIQELTQTVAFGGNYLINIGPTKEGTLPTIMEERLVQMGKWLQINGEAIYSSKSWTTAQIDSVTNTTYYTSNQDGDKIFAILLVWPGEEVALGSVNFNKVYKIDILGGKSGAITFSKRTQGGILVTMPRLDTILSRWAWTLAITLKN